MEGEENGRGAVRALLPGEASVDAALLDNVVADITKLHMASGLVYHLKLGELLLERFFNGDGKEYAQREKRHASFRALASREDLPMSASTLYNAVAVTRQYAALPEAVASQLHMAHHRALLPLRDDRTRQRLAKKAVDKGLTKNQLKAEVDKARSNEQADEKRGRPALPAFQKTLNLFGRVARTEGSFGDLDAIDDLDEETANALLQKLLSAKIALDDLQKKLQVKTTGFKK